MNCEKCEALDIEVEEMTVEQAYESAMAGIFKDEKYQNMAAVVDAEEIYNRIMQTTGLVATYQDRQNARLYAKMGAEYTEKALELCSHAGAEFPDDPKVYSALRRLRDEAMAPVLTEDEKQEGESEPIPF